jgi:hypothetical protein
MLTHMWRVCVCVCVCCMCNSADVTGRLDERNLIRRHRVQSNQTFCLASCICCYSLCVRSPLVRFYLVQSHCSHRFARDLIAHAKHQLVSTLYLEFLLDLYWMEHTKRFHRMRAKQDKKNQAVSRDRARRAYKETLGGEDASASAGRGGQAGMKHCIKAAWQWSQGESSRV